MDGKKQMSNAVNNWNNDRSKKETPVPFGGPDDWNHERQAAKIENIKLRTK